MEDAERVRSVCSAIPTVLDCTCDLVADEQFRFLDEECLPILEVVN